MIAGAVTGDREIVIQVDALAADRSFVSIQAVVDTGFNGFVTLPLEVLNALGATSAGTRRADRRVLVARNWAMAMLLNWTSTF